jgi:hypothetical protein
MYDRMLLQMRDAIRTRKYIMTLHAEEEMEDDSLSIFDIERIILTGTIIEQQRDQATGELKYLIEGGSISNGLAVVVAKISSTGKLVIITVYKA